MLIRSKQLEQILAEAQSSVQLLGTVSLDADWDALAQKWAEKLKTDPSFNIKILCESDNMLFSKSLTSDTEESADRRSFQALKFIRDRSLELPESLLKAGVPKPPIKSEYEKMTKEEKARVSINGKPPYQFSIEVMHLAIPISIAKIDNRIFANLWLHEVNNEYEEIEQNHPWHSFLKSYIQAYFDQKQGRKYACEPNDEILELFDHYRTPRGIYPRASFYDTDFSQLVVWALIFDRKGKVLIHRRKENAKDNQGMWDKSAGGHADFSMDVDTSRTVLREVIEELFEDEIKEKTNFRAWTVTDEEMLYLGEWRPKQRRHHPFREISNFIREWAFFRLQSSQHLYSPRQLPDGTTRRLRVISDVYLFVAGPGLTDESLGELKNSEFKLISLSELKSAMDKAIRNEEVPDFDINRKVPLFSPDLINIMTGELRDTLEEFSQYVKRYVTSPSN